MRKETNTLRVFPGNQAHAHVVNVREDCYRVREMLLKSVDSMFNMCFTAQLANSLSVVYGTISMKILWENVTVITIELVFTKNTLANISHIQFDSGKQCSIYSKHQCIVEKTNIPYW